MENSVVLLFLLLFRTNETSFLPFVADTNQNCTAPDKYTTEGSALCCSRCPPGHRLKKQCTETNDSLCEPCGKGQFMENWNFAPNCNSCSRCKEAKGLQFTQSCSSTTKARCGCTEGRYCSIRFAKECHECHPYKTCKKGSGVSEPGTNSSDVKCKECPEGTFSNTVSSTDACKPHTICDEGGIISKGNATSDTVCKPAAGTQIIAAFNAKPDTVSLAAATSAESPLGLTTNSTIPGAKLTSITDIPNLTKSQVPDTGPDKHLAAVVGVAVGLFLLIVVIVLLAMCKRSSKKASLEDQKKVDANGNCEAGGDNIYLCYFGDTHRLSVSTEQPEQQHLLQNGTVEQNHCTFEDHKATELIGHPQSTLPLLPPESEPSEPLPLQSNVYPFVSQNGSALQTSSQPTSPQNMTQSPLVNVNINLHIGNGTCGTPAVTLKDMAPAEPNIPFGEEEESCSLQKQEDGKPSLLSVEESGRFNTSLPTQDQFV